MSSLQDIQRTYEDLVELPADADATAKRSRGYAFERLLKALFTVDGLEPRAGSFVDGAGTLGKQNHAKGQR